MKTKIRKGPLKKTKTVLAFRRSGGFLDPDYVVFQEQQGELVSSRSIRIEREVVHDMGNPDVVTVTIEPGNTVTK